MAFEQKTTIKSADTFVNTVFSDASSMLDLDRSGRVGRQELRDLVASLQQQFGSLTLDTPADTTVTTGGTYQKLAGTTSLDSGAVNVDANSASNRLRYTGSVAKKFLVLVSGNVGNDTVASTTTFKLYKYDASAESGAVVADSIVAVEAAVADENTGFSMHHVIELDENDYLELHVTSTTNSDVVNVSNLKMTIISMFV